jgi:hypothetical protein
LADLKGKTVRLPPDLWEKLAERAEESERSVNYLIIQAVKAYVGKVIPDVGKVVSSQYQSGTTLVSTPDPARAPVHDDRQTDRPSEDTSPEQQIAELLHSLPWYGAKLPKDDTPEQRATTLLAANPKVDIAAELHRASEWLHDHPQRRKKQLGSFLASWMSRAGKPQPTTGRGQAQLPGTEPPKKKTGIRYV